MMISLYCVFERLMMNRSMPMTILLIALLLYAGFVSYLYFFQRSFIYMTHSEPIDYASVMLLERPDAKIRISARELDTDRAILYFGGNAENVAYNLPDFKNRFPNHAIYLMHYRGYGGSEGKPSEKAIIEDAFALYDLVAKKHKNIAVVGRSLGTGVAVRLAAEREVSHVVLITPYDSILYIAQRAFPYVPVGWLLKDTYESWRHAPAITAPTLIIMAENDEVIPAVSTRRLYGFFKEGVARLLVIPGTRHNSVSFDMTFEHAFATFFDTPKPKSEKN